MAGTSDDPTTPEQVREHNRNVRRELQFDSTRWVSVPRAIQALVSMLGFTLLQAAAELLSLMRNPSDALPTATRWCRWRDGIQTSHVVTCYPAPADWGDVPPESLLMDIRKVSEGDGNVVWCWDFVDHQGFNRCLNVLAERVRQAAKARMLESEVPESEVPESEPAEVTRRLRHGPQIDRVLRALAIHFPPDGKVPNRRSVKAVRAQLSPGWKEENRDLNLADPSWDAVKAAMEQLGWRSDD